MRNKLILTVLLMVLSLYVVGCSKTEKTSKQEDIQINNTISSEENINEDKVYKPIDINNVSEEVKKTYPQSIEYFKAINEINALENKEKATELLSTLKDYIGKTYPYDYSQAKNNGYLETIEDFGIMERLLINIDDRMFYEATNHENIIALNYYLETNDILRNRITITTKNLDLRNEICKRDKSEKLYNVYKYIIESTENKKDIDINDLKKLNYSYEKIEYANNVVTYKFTIDEEILIVKCLENGKKINNVRYHDMNLLYSENLSIEGYAMEFTITIDGEDISEQNRLFHKVLNI